MLYQQLILLLVLPLILGQEKRIKRLATPNYSEEVLRDVGKCVVSIRSRTPHKYFGDNHFCGGSIISTKFVLTAAHCVMDQHKIMYRTRELLIVAGTPNRLKHVLGETLNVPISKIFVPTNFTLFNTNNIALLKLYVELPKNNERIGIFNLPKGPPEFGQYYRVLGWGRVYFGGALASRILYIDVMLQTEAHCRTIIKSLKPEMLCAGNFNKMDEDPCPGDSGDPFIKNNTVYGVAAYGLGCGSPTIKNLPSVYTNVFYHIDWIKDIMENSQSSRLYPLPLKILFQLSLLLIVLVPL